MNRRTPLSVYVEVDMSQQRMARIWDGVAERVEEKHSPATQMRRWAAAGVGAAAMAFAVTASVVWLKDAGQTPSVWQGAALETAGDTLRVDLDDGSLLSLQAHTRVQVAENTEQVVVLNLDKGQLSCSVTENRQRRFSVRARDVLVTVTGTRFSVEVDDDARVSVVVQSGTVEVTPPGGGSVRKLGAGESWSLDTRQAERDLEAPVPQQAEPAVEEEPEERIATLPPPPSIAPRAPTPTTDKEGDATKPEQAAEGAAALSARELLEQGNAARRGGNAQQAANLYKRLLAEHPSDARAGLAAFELGRLRMDRLGDLQGAVVALRRAVTLAPGSGFREDAMARLVQAYAAMGAAQRCRSAKQAYLQAFPKGVHAVSVAQKCPAK